MKWVLTQYDVQLKLEFKDLDYKFLNGTNCYYKYTSKNKFFEYQSVIEKMWVHKVTLLRHLLK